VRLPKSVIWLLDRLSKSIRDLVSGLRYGYPVCCVFNYFLDSFLSIPSGLSRGEITDPTLGTYVPCHFHRRVNGPLSRGECLQLLGSGFAVEHLAPQDTVETLVNGKVVSKIRIPQGADGLFLSQIVLRDGA